MTQPRYSLMSEAYLSIYEGKPVLWDNIHAKRKRGEAPAKKGDKDYPKTLNVEEKGSLKQARKNVGADTCWDGYKAKGTKMKGGKSVPNCVKEDYINYLIDHRFAVDESSAEAMYDHMSDKWKMMIEDRIEEGVIDAALKSDKEMGKLIKDTDKDVKRVRKGGKFNYGAKNEEASDAMKDRRMMRGGVDGNTRYDRAPKPSRSSRQPRDGDPAFDSVVANFKKQYGDKAMMASKRTIKK